MRRIKAFILVLLISSSLLYSAEINYQIDSKQLVLQAGFGDVTDLYVERIPANNEANFRLGMPFDIEDEYIQFTREGVPGDIYGSGGGRLIARWGFLSNTKFGLKIEAEPLTPDDKSNGDVSLPYSLAFAFTMSYVQGGSPLSYGGYFIYEGDSNKTLLFDYKNKRVIQPEEDGFTYISELLGNTIDGGYVGSAEGGVFFGFTKASSDKIKNEPDSVPAGNYSAVVTIHIITEGR